MDNIENISVDSEKKVSDSSEKNDFTLEKNHEIIEKIDSPITLEQNNTEGHVKIHNLTCEEINTNELKITNITSLEQNKSFNHTETDNFVSIENNEVIMTEEGDNKIVKQIHPCEIIEKDNNEVVEINKLNNTTVVTNENKCEKMDSTIEVNNDITVEYVNISDKNKYDIDSVKEKVIEIEKSNCENSNKENTEDLFYIDKRTSLGAIALEYDSSDSECNKETTKNKTNVTNAQDYRNKDEVVLSSDESTSDSESDSSSSDSETDSDSSNSHKSDKDCSDESDTESVIKNKGNKLKKTVKQKGEFDDLPPIEDLKISVPEVLCDPLGKVAWTVEQMVVVRPEPGKPTLNLDTVLFIEKGKRALGHIFDVFGQVTEPHYCVRFNSSEHIQECDVKVGMTVYYCPNTPYTSLVFLSELKKMKAIDDIGEDEPPQFSDDEEEQAYYASLKNKSNKPKVQETTSDIPNKRRRANKQGWQSNHPWNSFREQQAPFYRAQHPWSRPRYPYNNPWYQYGLYPQNNWVPNYPVYNEMQTYNQYAGRSYADHTEQFQMQAAGFMPSEQNNYSQSQNSQTNTHSFQEISSPIATTFPLIPPPPPPPPSSNNNQ